MRCIATLEISCYFIRTAGCIAPQHFEV